MYLQERIDAAYAKPELDEKDVGAIVEAVDLLDAGELRVAHQDSSGDWVTEEWLKKAILLYFRSNSSEVMECGPFTWFDKVPLKQWQAEQGVRVVPQAIVRHGAYVERGAVLMPSYVNIGAYVGSGTMVDTWATVGSCAQVGRNVHLSGGVGIGGVLEPVQASPVVIEDDAFIGSRCIVVEGVRVCEGAVLGAGVVLTASTLILDVRGERPEELRGVVPPNAVVIPGSRPRQFPAGEFFVPCALIIGERSTSTDRKTALTDVLRDFDVAV